MTVTATGDLTRVFCAHVPASSPVTPSAELEGDLRARFDAARAAWPGVAIEASVFVGHVAERSRESLPPPAHAPDLYLACACLLGVPAGLEAFQRTFRADVARAIARTDASEAFLDDVMQSLVVKLFVRTGEVAPAIAEYAGRSSLRGWLTTVAKRIALNLRRRKRDQGHDELSSNIAELGAAIGPELALLKAHYKAELEASIRAALAALPDKERSLLLLHLVNGSTLPQLAAMQGVSRATVARWLASAREALFEGTRRGLVERLDLSPSEYDSLVALVRSQLEVSVVAAMEDSPAAR